jgi:hypothetical protein
MLHIGAVEVGCRSLWEALPPAVVEITADHLETFGDVDEVLSRFYSEAVAAAAEAGHIPEHRLRATLERAFITSGGTRGTVYAESEATSGIPNASIDELERRHLIRAEFRAGARWLELTHDRLIDPIKTSNRAFSMTRAESYRALAARAFQALGPLRVSLLFAVPAFVLFLAARGTDAYTTLGDSPLHRLGTLTIGAGIVVALELAVIGRRFGWAASFVMALALQEAFGAVATVAVETSRDGEFIPSRHRYIIAAGIAMALAAAAAAWTTRRNFGRRHHTWSTGIAALLALLAAATAFMPLLFSPLEVNAGGPIEQLFYENPWYRLEPVGIFIASVAAVLLVYRAAPRIAAGWLAGTATNTALYVAGVAVFASSTFGGYGNEIRPSGLALFGTAGLLAAAALTVDQG